MSKAKLNLMHPEILNPHLEMLAELVSNPRQFADYLTDDHGIGNRWLQLPLATRKLDMLLLWARDELILPGHGYRSSINGFDLGETRTPNVNRLFPGKFFPTALGAWLGREGDGNAACVSKANVASAGGRFWYCEVEVIWAQDCDDRQIVSEAQATRDMKRRVLRLFPQLGRKITMPAPLPKEGKIGDFGINPAYQEAYDAGMVVSRNIHINYSKRKRKAFCWQSLTCEDFLPLEQANVLSQWPVPGPSQSVPLNYCTPQHVADYLSIPVDEIETPIVTCIAQASQMIRDHCSIRYWADRLWSSEQVRQWAIHLAGNHYLNVVRDANDLLSDEIDRVVGKNAIAAYHALRDVESGSLSIADLATMEPEWENVRFYDFHGPHAPNIVRRR